MIIVTGAAGFIGSCLATELYRLGFKDLVLVDEFSRADKLANLDAIPQPLLVPRDALFNWLEGKENDIQFFFHIGARTDTAEFDTELLRKLNLDYSKEVWNWCCMHHVPLIYASSAATYGMGEHGFTDDPAGLSQLHPLNPYGDSKHAFDCWALEQEQKPWFWAGFKFFNVFGPNEYHKARMASVVMHAYNQIKQHGSMKLFRSHRPDYRDGEQRRDFIYVKDLLQVLLHFMEHRQNSGLYNLGTGEARSFLDLAHAVFSAMNRQPEIQFIDTPADIRERYQYFTEADTTRLLAAGYQGGFRTFEKAVSDYVLHYLEPGKYY
ncbi:MAG: ADP-glyceromanno-heptose 6-epimerase [Bacteroidota bacterium]|jgi:ADP-L-glycero-D-manno-heptose 6-epimerase